MPIQPVRASEKKNVHSEEGDDTIVLPYNGNPNMLLVYKFVL